MKNEVRLSPSWTLETGSGSPVLKHRVTGKIYGPSDVVKMYPSWPPQPARVSVRRAGNVGRRSDEERAVIEEFCAPIPNPAVKTAHIHIRTTMDRKNSYVRAARTEEKTLSEWMTDTCDEATK